MKRVNPFIFALVILFAGNLLGGQIKAAGKLLIPTAEGEKPYNGVITITQAEIKIKCDKKIFQLFNVNSKKTDEIKINMAEVDEIYLNVNRIYIIPETYFHIPRITFHKRYRHLFHPCVRTCFFHAPLKFDAMIFIVDNPASFNFSWKNLIKLKKIKRED